MALSIRSTCSWLARRPGYMLLTASPGRLADEPPERFAGAWLGLLVASVLSGALAVNVWGLSQWTIFSGFGVEQMPRVLAVAVMVLWPMRQAVSALADILGGSDATVRAAAAAVIVVLLAGAFSALRDDSQYRYDNAKLPALLAWLRLGSAPYRVLLLMPIWGAWAMLITGQFRRPDARAEPAVAALVKGCGPLLAAACMGGALVATILYFWFHFSPLDHLALCGSTIAAAIAGGLLLARLAGGLTRRTLLATNLLTQIVFLLAYVALDR